MPGPELRTATRTPFVWLCSVLIDNSRASAFDSVHCLDRVQDQVQKDLLQLNTIPLNGRQPLPKVGLRCPSVPRAQAARRRRVGPHRRTGARSPLRDVDL